MQIAITMIPGDRQAPAVARDWSFVGPEALEVRLPESDDWRYPAGRLIRALIEAFLCKAARVSREEIDAFDHGFTGDGEPGCDPNAPYHREHMLAELIERQFISNVGCEWRQYKSASATYDHYLGDAQR